MRHHRLALGGLDVEDQPVLCDAERERVRAALVAFRRKGVLLDQVVDRDRALVLDVGVGTADGFFVERNLDQMLRLAFRPAAHFGLSRIAMERAWPCRPSASPSAIAAGASARSDSGPHLRIDVRFMKSSTPRPDEKRAERAVGST